MSIEHMAMVFAADGIEAKARLLLLAYTNRCDDHGFCWPGEDRLVAETGMSASTVRRAKKTLTDMGLVKSIRRPDTSSMTRINLKLLASMRRPDREYDDNLMQKFGFAEDVMEAPERASDLRTGHPDLWDRSTWPVGEVILTCGPGQDDLKTPSEPSVEPPPSSVPHEPPVEGAPGGGGGGDAAQQGEDKRAAVFVDGLPYRGRLPGPKQRKNLVRAAAAAFAGGWTEDALERQLTADTGNAKSMGAVYGYRLEPENLPAPPASRAALPGPRAVVNDTTGAMRECPGQDGMCCTPLKAADGDLCGRCQRETAGPATDVRSRPLLPSPVLTPTPIETVRM